MGGMSAQIRALLCEITWSELQKLQTEVVLAQYNGNKTHAAKRLGISVKTLRNKLKRWGINESIKAESI